MAAGAMVTAAGAAVMLYYVLSRRLAREAEDDEVSDGDLSKSRRSLRRRRVARRPAQPPATLLESVIMLSETLRFTYSETLGKWPIGDLAFGINYFMRKQGNLRVASVYAGSDCVQLKGSEIVAELHDLLRLLTMCMFFSKKPFPVFLESAGFFSDDVLLQMPKAGLLRPAFTIIRDSKSKCFLLLIRGTHSIKDTLTAATGAVVPFHHSVLNDGGISNLVLGYAHCGMVAAARWIAKLCTPTLLKAIGEFPDFNVKIVGHSLGGGTAALLTYILREHKEFSSVSCVTFAPAACMTWELAESGKHIITAIINGSDLVPTFSASSVDDLRAEVTASSWLNDLRDQVQRTKVLNVVCRSATALGSHIPSISSAKARVAGAGAILRPVTSGTQVVMKSAQSVAEAVVRTRSSLSTWSCMAPRRRNVESSSNSKTENSAGDASQISEARSESALTEVVMDKDDHCYSSRASSHEDIDEEEKLLPGNEGAAASTFDDITEGQLWCELEQELQKKPDEEEEAAATKEIIEEENELVVDVAECSNTSTSSGNSDSHRFYPPGRIMHIVSVHSEEAADSNSISDDQVEERVCLYETHRELYSKLRLSKSMINDHYMPMYKKMMEQLIQELEKDSTCDCDSIM